MIGSLIFQYKILEKIGEGGMGVVYKAHDTRLGRDVALKFLPPHLSASEPDKLRFMQEARAAAALNHPNICTIYGIDEYNGPEGPGQMFIAMELVDGQTLRERMHSLSFTQAIDIGIQIADGLAAAHEKGIVHRDIKPENIMIRKDGNVQIMDFGLAKLRASGNKVNRLTQEGSTVGTLGYMSPEQVQGNDTDHRSDIFSFGVVLFEMFTGQLPFKAAHQTAMMYEIVNTIPAPPSTIKPELSLTIDTLVLDCLEKDPRERYQAAAEIVRALRKIRRESNHHQQSLRPRPGDASPAAARTPIIHLPIIWMSFAGLILITAAIFALLQFKSNTTDRKTYRSSILPPEYMQFESQGGGNLALSPDGNTLAFTACDSIGTRMLFLRSLNSLVSQPLKGSEGAAFPFWSPDGRRLGFFTQGKLKRIDATGGPAQTLCEAPTGRGGTWNADGVIVFAPSVYAALFKVSAMGGLPTPLTRFDTSTTENSHRWPQFLPDGKHFIYFCRTGSNEMDGIYVASIETGEKSKFIVHSGSNAVYSAGRLLFMRQQSLVSAPFELDGFRAAEPAIPAAEGVEFSLAFSHANFTASPNGMLAYKTDLTGHIGDRSLVWYDRAGKRGGELRRPGFPLDFRISPDGKRVAFGLFDPQSRSYDIWINELAHNIWTKLTFGAEIHRFPVWFPDGSKIAFTSNQSGHWDIYVKAATGAASEEALVASDEFKIPTDWSLDGRYLAYITVGDPHTKSDSWYLSLGTPGGGGKREAKLFLRTEANEGKGGVFSPDGKWFAYESDESGISQVYVRPFPGPGGKWQISLSGGSLPRWRRDGQELYYVSEGGKIFAVDIRVKGAAFEAGTPRPLFRIDLYNSFLSTGPGYDVTSDGQRFLVNTGVEDRAPSPVTLVVNWDEELQKK